MQENFGQSQELFRTSLKKFQTQNDKPLADAPKREYFADSLSKEVMQLKRKVAELEITLDTTDSSLKRVANDNKSKWNSIQDQVSTEIQTFGLLKDRIQLELDIIKKQRGLENNVAFKNQVEASKPQDNSNNADIKFLMDQYTKMQKQIDDLQNKQKDGNN